MMRPLKLGGAGALVLLLALAATWTVRRLDGQDRTVEVTGTIEALQVDVSARITARIVERTVKEGEPVERGQRLVRLADEEPAADVRRAEAALGAAQAQLADFEAGARREEIEQARAALRSANVAREWAERELGRVRQLFAKELLAFQEVDRASNAFDAAQANEASAREKVALLEAGPRPDAVAAARSQVAEARAALALARARLVETRLDSPLTGIVLRKSLEVGETATPGVPILTLMDPDDLWLRAYVSETDLGRVRLGQGATLTVDAYPSRTFSGVVSEIASEAEFTPKNVQTKKERVNLVYRMKIVVRNTGGVLKPGMPADARIHP
ncbi:MAG: hemolysin secretion protein D [Candidatus Rokuibacteriota bacterium]|nr:MAG: hemolysin secretion protein D [Candidatus Rokubacteria bacterium]